MATPVATDLPTRLARIAARCRGDGRRLVSVTAEVADPDPVATVFASRLAGDRWFTWEVPEAGFALGALGIVAEVVSRGPTRFADVAERCAELGRNRIGDGDEGAPAGAGPVWVGGFAFDPEGGRESHWSSFPPALQFLPEVAVVRSGESSYLTVCAVAGGGADPGEIERRVAARLAALRTAALPLHDPHPTSATKVGSVLAPGHYERAVAAAVERIRDGELEKVVLAREVRVDGPSAHDPAATVAALRELFPSCFCFCCGTPEGAFLGASPELLVSRRGASVASVALAGSTRRSADPAVDDHLGEQLLRSEKNRHEHAIVARRIQRQLGSGAVWVEAEREPALIKVANIQHLATPVHAQLAEPLATVELAGRLHPTPAVGGDPTGPALAAIAELERMDRGWYAGPVGWMDAAEDGEFCVALRSALLRDRVAHLYAGAGIVADSDPGAELAETELKLEAMLPLLAG